MKLSSCLKIAENNIGKIHELILFVSGKKRTGLYIAVVYVALILPVSMAMHTAGSYLITSENDFFSSYVPHAERLLQGNFVIDVYRGPLYVFTLAFVKFITGAYLPAGIIISSLSAGIFLYFNYLIIRQVFSSLTGFLVTLLTAVNPLFIVYSYAPGTDMFFIALCAFSLRYFLSANLLYTKNIILSSSFAALAFLTRYNAIFLFTIPFVILFFKHNFLNFRIKTALVFITVFFLITAPWGIFTMIEKGSVFYNENYRNVAISLGTNGDINWETAWNKNSSRFTSIADIIKKEPYKLAETVTANLVFHSYKNFVKLNILYISFFSIVGLLFIRIKKLTRLQSAYWIICLSFFVVLLPVFYDSRFYLFLLPPLLVLAYFGIKTISLHSHSAFEILFIPLLCYSILTSVAYNRQLISGQEEIKKIAFAFNNRHIENNPSGKIIASRMPHISYNLGMRWVLLPADESLNAAVKELAKQNVDYLYFSRREYTERKKLKALINPVNAPPALTPVVYIPEEQAVIYKLNKTLFKKNHLP